jgi:hypothetical protein
VGDASPSLRLASAFAQEYDETNVIPLDDYFDVPTPSKMNILASVVSSYGLTKQNGELISPKTLTACSGG